MCYSLLKYWCPSPSSKAPLIHPPHCSEVPAYKHTGTVREISSMGSRVGQGRWQRTGCRTCIAWVKGQYVPSVLSQNSDLTIQSEMKGRSPIFCCNVLAQHGEDDSMQRRGSPALEPEAGGNAHHMGAVLWRNSLLCFWTQAKHASVKQSQLQKVI